LKRGEDKEAAPPVPAVPPQFSEDERPTTAIKGLGLEMKTAKEGRMGGVWGLRGKSKLFLFLFFFCACQLLRSLVSYI
jgi:hypothetical protein